MNATVLRSYVRYGFPLSLLCLGIVYVLLARDLASFRAFWSPDVGARFVGVRNWLEHGNPVYLHYDHAALDPRGDLHPARGYLIMVPGGLSTVYPPLFLLLSGVFFRMAGFMGLALLSVLGGIAALYVTFRMARKLHLRGRYALPLLMGLATPLVLYSVVYWDHSLQMLLTALAGYAMLQALENRPRAAIAAGAALGLGVWIHELFLVMFLACLAGALLHRRDFGWRAVTGLAVGFGLLAVPWAVTNFLLYHSPAGPHFMGPNILTHPYHVAQTVSLDRLIDRSLFQISGDRNADPLTVRLVFLLGLYVAAMHLGGGLRRVTPLLHLAIAGFALVLVLRREWANGLFQATPLLALAFASRPEPAGQEAPIRERFFRWAGSSMLLFVLLILLNPIGPGLNWGSRYVLASLPLLMLLALRGIEWSTGPATGPRWLAAAGIAGLVAASLVSQGRGYLAIRGDLAYSAQLRDAIRETGSPLVVTDRFWIGPELSAADLGRTLLFLPENPEAPDHLLNSGEALQAREFTFVGSSEGLERLRSAAGRRSRTFVQVESRVHLGLHFVRFAAGIPLAGGHAAQRELK